MPNTMWSQRQTPRSSITASETFGYQPGPTYGNRLRQDCLASQQPSTKPGPAARRPRAQRRPPGTGWARAAHHVHADVQRVLLARLRLRAYSMTPGATRLVAARSLSASSRCGSRRTAPAGFARCPQRPTWSSSARRRRPSARSRTARTCRPARQGLLPLRRAGRFPLRLQQLQEDLVRQAGQALAPVLRPSATTSAAPRAPPAALGPWCPTSASARSTAPGC